jgi:hypothetical protein
MNMNSVTALSGVPPHLQGARGAPYSQAVYQAANGQPVYPEGVSIAEATCDLAALRRVYETEPNLNWFLRGLPEDGLTILRAQDAHHLERCARQFGSTLPRTLTIERGGSGVTYHIFLRGVAAPLFLMNRDVCDDVKVQVVSHAPLHNNVHRKSGELFRWRDYCAPGEVCAAFLPRGFVLGLPKRAGSRTLFVARRDEYTPPHSPRWTGN